MIETLNNIEFSILESLDVRGVSRNKLTNFMTIMYAVKGFSQRTTPEEIKEILIKLVDQGYLLEVKFGNQKQWRLTSKAVALLDQATTSGIQLQTGQKEINDWLAKANTLMNTHKFQDALVYLGKAMDYANQCQLEQYPPKIQILIQECMKSIKQRTRTKNEPSS
ncbi:MAG: hypothetical protein ACFFCZ_28535 [Promethearchaeota archaeon]